MSKGKSATQVTKEATDHKLYGCTWITTLTQGERLCSVCGRKAYCAYCTRSYYPLNALVVACLKHKDVENR